jgi:hypothetical protein
MQVVAAAKAQVVAQAKADCEELLVAIVQVRLGAGCTPLLTCSFYFLDHTALVGNQTLDQLINRPTNPRTSTWPTSRRRWSTRGPPRSGGRQRRPTLSRSRWGGAVLLVEGGRGFQTHINTNQPTNDRQVSTELERALPALREAEEALNVLTKKDISELKVGGWRAGSEESALSSS